MSTAAPSYDSESLAQAIAECGEGEVSASWTAKHAGEFRLIDVREPHELEGPLGKVESAQNLPLLQVLGGAAELDPSVPVVLLCRSGRRSGIAAEALRRAGVSTVASVEGGMLAWNVDVFENTGIVEEERYTNTQNLTEAVFATNGLPEVSAQWVQDNVGRFRLFDVREANELAQHGRVAQSEHVPMQSFMSAAERMDRAAPMVVMCASGGRSGRVVQALAAAGFSAVASLEGGMFGWRAQALPVA